MVVASWGLYGQDHNHDSIISDWFIISCAWQWYGEDSIQAISVSAKDHTDDKRVVQRMHEVLSKADVLCGHNGDAFDLKKFNARAIFYGLEPIPPKPSIDTLKEARKHFKFSSNRLDYLGQYLGLGKKMDTPKGLWMDVLKGKSKAIKTMVEYNKKDVVLLRRVYEKLKPFMRNHPNRNLFSQEECCPTCSSENYQSRGYRLTRTTRRRQYQCQDCGSWFTGTLAAKVNLR